MHRTRIRDVEDLLDANEMIAGANRAVFDRARLHAVNFIGASGAGKTSLLEQLVPMLGGVRVGVIEGDASAVRAALPGLPLDRLDLLMIESVGDPAGAAGLDVGEDARVVVSSIPEGEEKPLACPRLFRACDLVLLNKMDLLAYRDFQLDRFERNLRAVHPGVTCLRVSARSGEGLAAWADWMRALVLSRRVA
jgi:hydrogenase nickel incorporation protein HypB